jgi:hypothetical protein
MVYDLHFDVIIITPLESAGFVHPLSHDHVDVLVVVGGTFPPRRPFLDEKKILEAREPLNKCGNTPEQKSAYPRTEVGPEE